MKESEWITKGTTSFPRWDGRTFTVIPASSIFFAMYEPNVLVEKYGYPKDEIKYITGFLSHSFGYKEELLENITVKIRPISEGYKRDLGAEVSSAEKEGLYYVATLMNLLFPPVNLNLPSRRDVINEVKNWKVLDYRCGCGRGSSIDEYCSMPFDCCSPWGISLEEYNESFEDETVSKFYGKVLCKHEASGLAKTGRYRIFNQEMFQSLFNRMMRALSNASKEGEKLMQTEMDVALNSYIREMGFGDILEYFKQIHKSETYIEPIEERLVRKLGRPTISRS